MGQAGGMLGQPGMLGRSGFGRQSMETAGAGGMPLIMDLRAGQGRGAPGLPPVVPLGGGPRTDSPAALMHGQGGAYPVDAAMQDPYMHGGPMGLHRPPSRHAMPESPMVIQQPSPASGMSGGIGRGRGGPGQQGPSMQAGMPHAGMPQHGLVAGPSPAHPPAQVPAQPQPAATIDTDGKHPPTTQLLTVIVITRLINRHQSFD